jgi:hypothetical protein
MDGGLKDDYWGTSRLSCSLMIKETNNSMEVAEAVYLNLLFCLFKHSFKNETGEADAEMGDTVVSRRLMSLMEQVGRC